MERALDKEEDPAVDIERMKKSKGEKQEEEEEREETGFVNLDENLLFEVFKHVDARSLARASCVNKQWHKTCQDKRLWEMICTRHFANTGSSPPQLRSAALALGGFRGLQSNCFSNSPTQWGKDDVQLYLSLLSIRHFEKMNASHRGKRWT